MPYHKYGLPKYIPITSQGPGSQQYEQATWFSNTFKNKFGVFLNNKFSPADETSIKKLFSHDIDFAFVGLSGSYFAQEGLFSYANLDSGPRPVRLIANNDAPVLRTLVYRSDLSPNALIDLKGRKFAWIKSNQEINYLTLSLLSYFGIGKKDIELVEIRSPEEGVNAVLAGDVDFAFSTSLERVLFNKNNFKNGASLRYVQPTGDLEKLNQLEKIAPFFEIVNGSIGANLSKDYSVVSMGYPYPSIITNDDQPESYVESFLRATRLSGKEISRFDDKGIGWGNHELPLNFILPYHSGAIRDFKIMGLWTPKHQERNDKLIYRQKVLSEAWIYAKLNHSDSKNFNEYWYEIRKVFLEEAGLSSGFLDYTLLN